MKKIEANTGLGKQNKGKHLINLPLEVDLNLKLSSFSIVNSLMRGTDSNEWLLRSEKIVYEKLKAGLWQ